MLVALAAAGAHLQGGDIALIRARWDERADINTPEFWLNAPWMTAEAAIWLRERGIKATIPERDDQIAHRRKRPGRPIDFGDDQRERYKGRNVVERCFNFVKQWRGLASRYDKTARSYAAGICLSAALQWI